MRLNIILALMMVVFILAMPPSFATKVSKHSILVELNEFGDAHFKVEVAYEELTTNKIYYAAYSKIKNLEARDSLGGLVCSTEIRSYGVEIECNPKDIKKTDYKVQIDYDVPSIISQSMDTNVFTYTMNTREPTEILELILVLPEGSGIVDEANFDAYYPKNGVIGGTGRRATVTWVINNPILGKATDFNVYFEKIGINNDNSFFTITIIIILLILFLILFFRYKSHISKKSETVLSVLKNDEKKILEAIQEKGENCRQRDIVKLTDFSKARVSRILDDLEIRGIIERTRSGRTNKVKIKDTTLKIPKTEKEKKDISPFS